MASSINPIIVGIVSALIAIISYFIDLKLTNEKYNQQRLIKITLLGVCIGISNIILFTLLQSNIKSISTQDIMTGNPDF
jgi:uncharacterized membrane protein